MLYKTIVLGLLESHPGLHRRLRQSRTLQAEVERYAADLRREYLELQKSYPEDAAREMALATMAERIAAEAARIDAAT